ncbi:MAG: (5-formylfuran-3-yl)methyl phosphate synthase [Candidatus Methylomirabilales bacterium]
MRLLVSVVDAQEAEEAILGGAEIIDIKNPREGSLGAQPPGKIAEIVSVIPPGVEMSAAIGDVPNLPGTAALAAAGAAQCGVNYVKVGLLHVTPASDAMDLLTEVRLAVKACNPMARVIACTYADMISGSCLLPAELPGVAAAAGVDGCMVDTARKDGKSLRTWMATEELQLFVFTCRQASLFCGLAGSLQGADFEWVRRLAPDVVGVRGAACTGDRVTGRVSRDQVANIRDLLLGGSGRLDLRPHSLPRS